MNMHCLHQSKNCASICGKPGRFVRHNCTAVELLVYICVVSILKNCYEEVKVDN